MVSTPLPRSIPLQVFHFEGQVCRLTAYNVLQRMRCCQTLRSGGYMTDMARRGLKQHDQGGGGGGAADIFSQ